MMINQWHLEPPQLIISVTGGTQRFDLKHRMQETLKRGLMNAATSTCKSCPNVPTQCMSFTKDVFWVFEYIHVCLVLQIQFILNCFYYIAEYLKHIGSIRFYGNATVITFLWLFVSSKYTSNNTCRYINSMYENMHFEIINKSNAIFNFKKIHSLQVV